MSFILFLYRLWDSLMEAYHRNSWKPVIELVVFLLLGVIVAIVLFVFID